MRFAAPESTRTGTALIVSISLHAVILAAGYLLAPQSPRTEPAVVSQSLKVQLVSRVPRSVPALPPTSEETDSLPMPNTDFPRKETGIAQGKDLGAMKSGSDVAATEAEKISPPLVVDAHSRALETAQVPQPTVTEKAQTQEQMLINAVQALVRSGDAVTGPSEADAEQPFNPLKVQTHIGTYVRKARPDFIRNRVSDCWLEHQQHPLTHCTRTDEQDVSGVRTGRQIVTAVVDDLQRDKRAARRLQTLQKRDAQLLELMEQQGPVAAVAGTLHAINKEYQMYLSGNYNLEAWNFVKSANRMDGNLEFTGSFLQFDCGPEPCKYNWTGFSVELPDEWKRQREDEFTLTPVLFGSRPGGR